MFTLQGGLTAGRSCRDIVGMLDLEGGARAVTLEDLKALCGGRRKASAPEEPPVAPVEEDWWLAGSHRY
jgi:hypothetical protein